MSQAQTPAELFAEALALQVPSVSVYTGCSFPPPLGIWLTRGSPSSLKSTAKKCKVTPAGMVHYWMLNWPFRLQVETWGKKALEKRYNKWPGRIKMVYVRDRGAMAALFEVKGQMSDPSRLACARYGAWRAMAAEGVELMRLPELSWAGLAVQALGSGPIAYAGEEAGDIAEAVGAGGDAWWLLSDNCVTEPRGAVSFRVAEILELLDAGKEAQIVAWVVKQTFVARGSRVAVTGREIQGEAGA